MHTAEMHTHTQAVQVWAHGNKDGNAYIVYTIQWHMRAWGCIYQMSVYTIYGDKRMHMHSCSLFFSLSLLSFCGAVAKLPDSTSWGAFLAKVLQVSTCFACLTYFYLYSSAPGFCLCLWNCHKHLCWLLTAQGFSLQVLNLPLCMVEGQAFMCVVVHVYI